MILILDTETNGLPICPAYGVFHSYTDLTKYNSARVVQISYIVTDDVFNQLEESDTVIKRDNYLINNHQFHGITNEISDTKGIPFNVFAEMFNNVLDLTSTIFAHNIDFDKNVLFSEFYRINRLDIIEKFKSKALICSMRLTKSVVKARFKTGEGFKNPNLKELYQFATGKVMQNHHTCIEDVHNLRVALKIIYPLGV